MNLLIGMLEIPVVEIPGTLPSDSLPLLIFLLADYVPVRAYTTLIPRGVIVFFSGILSEVMSD